MIEEIDLKGLLGMNGGRLKGVKLYGVITGFVSKYVALGGRDVAGDGGEFAAVKLVGVLLKGYEKELTEQGVWNKIGQYLVSGDAAVYVERGTVKTGELREFSGTLRLQGYEGQHRYVCMMEMRKVEGGWQKRAVRTGFADMNGMRKIGRLYEKIKGLISGKTIVEKESAVQKAEGYARDALCEVIEKGVGIFAAE